MTVAHNKKREGSFDNTRPIDYRNVELLRKFVNPHARILSQNKSNLSSKKQRELKTAIKRARFMALIPYIGS
jgi:small subunit ribosomal protein S18